MSTIRCVEECDEGRARCCDCEGVGELSVRIYPRKYHSTDPSDGCIDTDCERCGGSGHIRCETCAGVGSYEEEEWMGVSHSLPEVA